MTILIGLVCLGLAILGIAVWRGKRRPRVRTDEERTEARRVVERLKVMASQSLLMRPTEAAGFSKLGGNPELPVGADWPVGPEGPLGFILQVDLATVRRQGGPDWLPDTGALYAFHDDRGGMADQVRIVFSASEMRAPLPPPAALPREWRYGERRIDLRAETSFPSQMWLGQEALAVHFEIEDFQELPGLKAYGSAEPPLHRLAGYPDEIQDERMPLSCEYEVRGLARQYGVPPSDPEMDQAAEDWRLLLQIDSDEDLKMNWPGGGRFYIFIREPDARAGDFSRTVCIWQGY
jgi:uncharacterized protein YwqG